MAFKTPEWLENVFAIIGLSRLQDLIERERDARANESYRNAYPEINTLVHSMHFEAAVAGVVLLNGLVIGMDASLPRGTKIETFEIFEHFFTTFFLVEWCLRVLACGWVWIFEPSNFGDTILVFGPGVLLKWVLEPAGVDVEFLRIFTVLRFLRLVRVAKAVRLMPQFKEMWILIHGLTTSARPLLWVLTIATAVLFLFAVAGTELIGNQSDFADDPVVQELFGNLLRSMFTMLQLITLDTWVDLVATPVMDKQPFLSLFFIGFIGIGVFVFWNLVTAIVVESAFEIVQQDSAAQAKAVDLEKKKELTVLAELFLEIDKDGSGEITEEEFMEAMMNAKVQQVLVLLDMKPEDMTDMWKILDEGEGSLTIREFTNGLRRMKGEATAKDVTDCMKRLLQTEDKHRHLEQQMELFQGTLVTLEEDASRIAEDTDEILGLFYEMYHRLCDHLERGKAEAKALTRSRAEKARVARLSAAREEAALVPLDEDDLSEQELEEGDDPSDWSGDDRPNG